MIQTKQPISYDDRENRTGIILVEIPSFYTDKNGVTFLVNDWIVDENGNKTIYKAIETWRSNAELDAIDSYLSSIHDFSGMTKTEEQWKKIELGLMFDTQMLLLDNGKTIYKLNPEDWEFTK